LGAALSDARIKTNPVFMVSSHMTLPAVISQSPEMSQVIDAQAD
jgi:hypothetical protein